MTAAELDLEQLYSEHFPLLLEIALSHCIPVEEAHELAHAVLLATIRRLPRIDDLATWLQGALECAIAGRQVGV